MRTCIAVVPALSLAAGFSVTLVGGFQLPPSRTQTSNVLLRPRSRDSANIRISVPSLYGKNDSEDDNSKVPFFARLRTAWKERKQDDSGKEETETEKEGGAVIAVAEKAKPPETKDKPRDPRELALDLRAQAEKTRLEADRMDAVLTLEKIGRLEKKLESKSLLENHPDEAADIRRQLDMLNNKLNGPPPEKQRKVQPTTATPEVEDVKEPRGMVAPGVMSPQLVPSLKAELKNMNLTSASKEDLYALIPPMAESELQTLAEDFRKTPKMLQEMAARSAEVDDVSNATAIVEQMYKDEQYLEIRKELRALGQIEQIDEETLAEAMEGYMQLPLAIQDMIARSIGFKDGRNASAVVAKMEEDGKLFSENDGENSFAVNTEFVTDIDLSELFKEAESGERNRFIESQLPVSTRKADQIPSREDVDVFFKEVLGKDTFNPTENPISVPGGFLIYGDNRKKSSKELIALLDAGLAKTNVAEKLQYFYMIDPSPISKEQMESLEGPGEKPPVLFITGPDVSPITNKLVKPLVSLVGILFMASFAVGSQTLNEAAMTRFFDELDASGVADLTWVQTNAVPIFVGLCLVQLGHESGHQLVAWRDKFKVGFPTIVPSLQIGLQGGITPIKTPPKDNNSLFDFALAGPLTGIMISIVMLLSGLEATTFMDATAQGGLPSLPISLVRSSSLAGAMVEKFLGGGILLTPNPAIDTINLHPLAIAGFVGLMSNALALLPLGNTDGGRIAQALFGRSWCRILTTFTSLTMVILGIFGKDEANLLLFYSFFATIAQRETELPCKNEVDDLDVGRALVALGVFFLVMLTLAPMA